MAHVISQRIVTWLNKNPGRHRTFSQGTQIACPLPDRSGFHSAPLPNGPFRTHICPKCHAHLNRPLPITIGEEGEEFWWSAA